MNDDTTERHLNPATGEADPVITEPDPKSAGYSVPAGKEDDPAATDDDPKTAGYPVPGDE